MINFYHRFLPKAAFHLAPLTEMLKKKASLFCMSPDLVGVFDKVKRLLVDAVELVHPDPDAPVSLVTDASDSHVGAVLPSRSFQRHRGPFLPPSPAGVTPFPRGCSGPRSWRVSQASPGESFPAFSRPSRFCLRAAGLSYSGGLARPSQFEDPPVDPARWCQSVL